MKTLVERRQVLTEIEASCTSRKLMGDLGTKIMLLIVKDYVANGTPYLNKEVRIVGNSTPELRASVPCKYVINLYNDLGKQDTVVIRAQNLLAV
jgi:hypothetical protein